MLLSQLCVEMEIPIALGGSTTFQRDDVERGLEPDECFWIAHEAVVRALHEIDLSVDPPPDLAIEIDISPSRLDRPRIYAALKVPEIWRFNGEDLHVELLQSDGTYRPSETSAAFPFLPVVELLRFVALSEEVGLMRTLKLFGEWVREQSFPTLPGGD
jgi:Uma2 family endonuclease